MTRTTLAATLAFAILAAASPAGAQEVRDFSPDRPSRSDSPFTVPPGYIQIESDLANYTNTGEIWQTLDPTLKYGLTDLIDAEIEIGGLVSQRTPTHTAHSFGDVTVRLKAALLGDDGGAVSIALIPYVKAPTARPPIGNGQVEGGLAAPVLINLPYEFALTLEPELAALKNTRNTGKQASLIGVANLGRRIAGDLSGFVELYDQVYTDRAAPGPTVTVDTGLAYAVTKTIQVDVGVNLGVNGVTPDVNVYGGIATRF